MKALIATLLLALSSAAFADWVIMTPEEQELKERFPAQATRDDAGITLKDGDSIV